MRSSAAARSGNTVRSVEADALWLEQTLTQLGLSIRAWQRLLKVLRTLADMEGAEDIARHHCRKR